MQPISIGSRVLRTLGGSSWETSKPQSLSQSFSDPGNRCTETVKPGRCDCIQPIYQHQLTMKHQPPMTRSPPRIYARSSATTSALLASLGDLPRTVQKMMEERGVTAPEELRSTEAFVRFLEQSVHPSTLSAVTDPQGGLRGVLSIVRGDLSSRSAQSLAVHLYTKELLRLVSIAAAREHLAEARDR
jgi:hypothetical protein